MNSPSASAKQRLPNSTTLLNRRSANIRPIDAYKALVKPTSALSPKSQRSPTALSDLSASRPPFSAATLACVVLRSTSNTLRESRYDEEPALRASCARCCLSTLVRTSNSSTSPAPPLG